MIIAPGKENRPVTAKGKNPTAAVNAVSPGTGIAGECVRLTWQSRQKQRQLVIPVIMGQSARDSTSGGGGPMRLGAELSRRPQVWWARCEEETVSGLSTVSARSRASLAAIDRTVVTSSDDAAWTSLLVERHVVTPAGQVVDIPPTPDQTIVVGIRGAQQVEVRYPRGWRQMIYGAGTVGLTVGGRDQVVRRRRAGGCSTFEKINIYVPQATVQRVVEDCRRTGIRAAAPIDSLGADDRTVEAFAHALVRAADRGAPDLYAQSAAQWLVTHLVIARTGASADAAGRRPGRLTDARLSAVLDLIRGEFAAPLSLDRLAAEARVSKYHFGRLFRQATGVTPHAYLVRVRLDAAREMLAGTDLSIGQIARRCGYAGASHFSAAFAARFSMPPGAYRSLSRSHAALDHRDG